LQRNLERIVIEQSSRKNVQLFAKLFAKTLTPFHSLKIIAQPFAKKNTLIRPFSSLAYSMSANFEEKRLCVG
jgi:hypothetical protein